jgi:hypothetical protein
MREPFIAGLLSFLVPGLGQIVHIIAAYFAYSYAKEHPVRGVD